MCVRRCNSKKISGQTRARGNPGRPEPSSSPKRAGLGREALRQTPRCSPPGQEARVRLPSIVRRSASIPSAGRLSKKRPPGGGLLPNDKRDGRLTFEGPPAQIATDAMDSAPAGGGGKTLNRLLDVSDAGQDSFSVFEREPAGAPDALGAAGSAPLRAKVIRS